MRDPVRRAEYQIEWRAQNPDYMRDYMRVWSRERHTIRMEMLQLLKNVPCADCGNRFPSVCMDFDHGEWGKKSKRSFSARAQREAWEPLVKEMKACDVVCANCHRIRTERQRHGRQPRVERTQIGN